MPHTELVPRRDAAIVQRLLAGDEATFVALVAAHHGALVRAARGYVRADDVAEEVVQETWMALLQGLSRFQGRASLKTWLFRILANRARTRARREVRTTPMSAIGAEAPVCADDFDASTGWNSPPPRWLEPQKNLQDRELGQVLASAIEALPPRQRTVLELRDIEGWSSEEVRAELDLSEANQRVLLHRARSKVRAALAPYLGQKVGTPVRSRSPLSLSQDGLPVVSSFSPKKIELAPAMKQSTCASSLICMRPADRRTLA
jgi:RNA polymerase sigma-70 factor (ECF subfamily)